MKPKTKAQLKQWITVGEHAPKKAEMVPSTGKLIVFWDIQDVIFIDYLPKTKTPSFYWTV